MAQVVEHLAELTAFRDRDVLDVTLVTAFNDLLRPLRVAIYHPVGENGNLRWLTRARLSIGQTTPSADSAWVDFEQLPPLAAYPQRLRCLNEQAVLAFDDAGRSATLFPLDTEREVVGVLEIHTDAPLADEQHRLVSAMLRVYRNFQGLLDYSERDTLTGLLNRKTFDDAVLRRAAQAALAVPPTAVASAQERRRTGEGQTWLGVIDIDRFKSINDQHGHLIGDEVLLLLARLMRASFRFRDQLYRFGGEEFVVLLDACGAGPAEVAFERMRCNVQDYAFPRVGRVTVSVGFTELRRGDTPAAAFDRADKAIYFAKQHGRNQVAHHEDLVRRGLLADESLSGDMELF